MIRFLFHFRRQRPGAALLITVLIVGSVALLITMGIALRGIAELDAAVRTAQSQRAMAMAESCLQHTLLGLWEDKSFARSGASFAFDDGTCTAETHTVPEHPTFRELRVKATVGRFTKMVRAVVDTRGYRLELKEEELL